MAHLTFTQDEYDLLISFCDWLRQFAEEEDFELGSLEMDTNDDIVQRFLTENDR